MWTRSNSEKIFHTYMLDPGKVAKQKISENRDLKMAKRRKTSNQRNSDSV